eukprot:CAMPEP_0185169950 /NCGR_PEP_ID=MMETSP1139-20130426/18010_1 /TAXON_ID=298111 /ORGANISM="Pavlova sp., Strain CCMP459" /LENGTH=50 /DNA_ID=CAMNT_0027735499 /DNA_START=64 /DNA_END=214 /DNA_ORIENTATION=+
MSSSVIAWSSFSANEAKLSRASSANAAHACELVQAAARAGEQPQRLGALD